MRNRTAIIASIVILSSIFIAYIAHKSLHKKSKDPWSGFSEIKLYVDDKGVEHKAMFRKSTSDNMPLVVVMHTWSGTYLQHQNSLNKQAKKLNYNYIYPNLSGAQDNPEACCSESQIKEIDFAIEYAIKNTNCDKNKIAIVGASGGGYVTLCALMKAKSQVAAYSAWVPITDLESWYFQSSAKNSGYAQNVLACTDSGNSIDTQKCMSRSPVFMDTPTARINQARVKLYAGIRDGHNGAVPISHSIDFYNKISKDLGCAPVDESTRKQLLDMTFISQGDDLLGDRKAIYRASCGTLQLTIFDGGHEMLPDIALATVFD